MCVNPPLSVGWGVSGMGGEAAVGRRVVRPLFHGIWPFLDAEILARVELVWECPPLAVRRGWVEVVRGGDSSGGGSISGGVAEEEGGSSGGFVEAVGIAVGGSMVVVVVPSSTLADAARRICRFDDRSLVL